jgi:hypothetical protein
VLNELVSESSGEAYGVAVLRKFDLIVALTLWRNSIAAVVDPAARLLH